MKEDAEHPTITIEWRDDVQGCNVRYDERIKSWDFRIAMLEMAVSSAKFDLNVARVNKQNELMQAQLQQALRAQQEANGINKILKG